MKMEKIPENSTVGHEEELEALDRLWNTLKMILFKERLTPAYVQYASPVVHLGLSMGLIIKEEAQWLLDNLWWITTTGNQSTDSVTILNNSDSKLLTENA